MVARPKWLEPILLFLTAVLVRLPFLPPSLGIDDDGYRLLLAGRFMAMTGHYAISRFPSYPIPELASIALWGLPSIVLLAITLALAGACVVTFHSIWQVLIGKGAFLGSLAFAFTSVFFSESVQFMDYMPATLLLLLSLRWTVSRRYVLAGVLFGLCVATRLSYAPFLLPLLVFPFAANRRIEAAKMAASAICVAALLYIVPFASFGTQLLSPVGIGGDDFSRVLFRGTARVWGVLGTLGVLASLAWVGRSKTWAWCGPVALAIGYLQFARFPYDYGYLLPCVPFALLWAAKTLPQRAWVSVAALIAVGPFLSLNKDKRVQGTAFADLQVAREREAAAQLATRHLNQSPDRCAILADLAPQIEWEQGLKSPPTTVISKHNPEQTQTVYMAITRDRLEDLRKQGKRFFVLEYNLDVVNQACGFDVSAAGVEVVPTIQ